MMPTTKTRPTKSTTAAENPNAADVAHDSQPSGMAAQRPADGVPSQLAYLARVLKTPTIGRVWEDLAEHAREANGPYPRILDMGCDYAAGRSVAV